MKNKNKYPSRGMNSLAKKRPDVAKKIMGYKKGGKVKKGYHKMPDGKMMKGSKHKGKK